MQKPEIKKPKKRPNPGSLLRYSGMGLQMAAIMLAGAWAGSKLDQYLQVKNNLCTAAGVVIGLFLGLYLIIKDLMKTNKE